MVNKSTNSDCGHRVSGSNSRVSHRLVHTSIVVGCTILSAAIMYCVASIYGSIRGGEIFVFSMAPLLCVSALMMVLGAVTSRSSRKAKIALIVICLGPATGIAGVYLASDISFRANGPADRFRDYLADPIPASVTQIRFATLQEEIDPDLVLWFRIMKPDLDRIIQNQGYYRVTPGKFANRNDYFNNPSYLRIGDGDEFYQRVNQFGEVFTLRVNEQHTAGVFRRDSLPR